MIVLSLPLFDFRPVSWPLHAWSIASSYRVQHPNDDDKYTDNLWTCQALSVGDGKKKQQKVRKFNDLKGGKKFRLRLKNPLLARVYLKSSPEVDAAMAVKRTPDQGHFCTRPGVQTSSRSRPIPSKVRQPAMSPERRGEGAGPEAPLPTVPLSQYPKEARDRESGTPVMYDGEEAEGREGVGVAGGIQQEGKFAGDSPSAAAAGNFLHLKGEFRPFIVSIMYVIDTITEGRGSSAAEYSTRRRAIEAASHARARGRRITRKSLFFNRLQTPLGVPGAASPGAGPPLFS